MCNCPQDEEPALSLWLQWASHRPGCCQRCAAPQLAAIGLAASPFTSSCSRWGSQSFRPSQLWGFKKPTLASGTARLGCATAGWQSAHTAHDYNRQHSSECWCTIVQASLFLITCQRSFS